MQTLNANHMRQGTKTVPVPALPGLALYKYSSKIRQKHLCRFGRWRQPLKTSISSHFKVQTYTGGYWKESWKQAWNDSLVCHQVMKSWAHFNSEEGKLKSNSSKTDHIIPSTVSNQQYLISPLSPRRMFSFHFNVVSPKFKQRFSTLAKCVLMPLLL